MPAKDQEKQIALIFADAEKKITAAKLKALNNVSRSVFDKAVDLVAGELHIDRGMILRGGALDGIDKPAMRFIAATPAKPVAEILARSHRIPLYAMGGQWQRSDPGASYVGRKGVRRTVPHSFVAKIGGRRSIYKRAGKARFPVEKLFGSSVPYVFIGDAVQIPLKRYIRERLSQEFAKAYRNA